MINNYRANYAMKKREVVPDPKVCIIYIYDNYILVYLPYATWMFRNVFFSILLSYSINSNSLTSNMNRKIRIFAIGMCRIMKVFETLVYKKLVKVTILVMLR